MLINKELLDGVSALALSNERLRQNYDLRNNSDDQSQRMLNALEPGTILPIHRHTNSSETMVVLRGAVREYLYDSNGDIIANYIIKAASDLIGINIPKGQWHNLECLESGTVIFEAKDKAYTPISPTDILNLKKGI